MTDNQTPDWEAELDRLAMLVARLEDARADDLALDTATFGDVIRHVPGSRLILHGTLDDRAVIFRMGLEEDNAGLARTWAEMRRLWPYMCEGRYRIAEPIHYTPDHDLMVIEAVSGTPLLQYIWQAEGDDRTRYFRPAAEWYRAATAMTEGHRIANPGGWLKRATRSSARQPFPELKKLEGRILLHLERLAGRIEGGEWRTAICHGDLHPNNLIVDGARVNGIDFGGSSRLPIYKDMSRFLMHMGRRCLIPSGQDWMGVDAMVVAEFVRAFALDEAEQRLILPFMLGIEALVRVETPTLPASRIKRAERMYRRLHRDLVAHT